MMETTILGINNLLSNKGQIEGVPRNPRTIRDEKFIRLKKSLVEDPDMLHVRELMVYPFKNKFVVIGGNMRLEALKELGYTSIPCKILRADTDAATLRRYALKDNGSYGDWDHSELSSNWDEQEILDSGIDIPITEVEEDIQDGEQVKDISTTLKVECENVVKLRELFIELQQRGFICELKN